MRVVTDGERFEREVGILPDDVKVSADLVAAVTMQNDTIRKLADSIRILNNRVERLERDRPTRPIG